MQAGEMVVSAGMWKARWRRKSPVGLRWSPRVSVAPADGPFAVPRAVARQIFAEVYLTKLEDAAPPSGDTLGGFVEDVFYPQHADRTRHPEWYRALVRNHVPEWLSAKRLIDVTKADVQRVCDGMAESGYAGQTVRHVRAMLHRVFEAAADEDRFDGRNPAKGVRVAGKMPKETFALAYDEARALIDALASEDAREVALFALLSGCRISEILGLKWLWVNVGRGPRSAGAVRLPPRSVAIRQQWYRGKLGPLKSAASERVIPLSDPMAAILLRRSGGDRGKDRFAFAARTGNPLDGCTLAARHLKPAAAFAGVPAVSWHAFRHTHNTWLFDEGVSEAQRMAQLGHKATGINARYLHVRLDDRRDAVDRIAAKLCPSVVQSP